MKNLIVIFKYIQLFTRYFCILFSFIEDIMMIINDSNLNKYSSVRFFGKDATASKSNSISLNASLIKDKMLLELSLVFN